VRGTLTLFASLLLLQALLGQANHELAPLHIYLFAGGLFVPYAAFMMPIGQGMAVSLLGGMICDAASPAPFGTHTLLFAGAHALLFNLRARFPREDPAVQLWAALAVNLAFFIVLSYMTVARTPVRTAALPRILADLAWSELVVATVAPWFFALQGRILEIAKAEPWRTA
jgi:cell shape-determining protein MreD